MAIIDLGTAGFLAGRFEGEMKLREMALKEKQVTGTLDIMQQKVDIQKDYLKIAQADLGIRISDQQMKQEMFSWKREDRMKLKKQQEGIMQAADAGGYAGVIEHLKATDPVKAIEFHSKKLELDAGIMKNEVYRGEAASKKREALFQGYQFMGKMGMAIMNAPPGEQNALYQRMLPMIKKVNPDAPNNLVDAAPQMMLGFSLSHPASIHVQGQQDINKYNSELPKLQQDLANRTAYLHKQGIDPKTDKVVQGLNAEINNKMGALRGAEEQVSLAELKRQHQEVMTQTKIDDNTRKATNDLYAKSKGYSEFMNLHGSATAQIDLLKNDPTNAAAQGTLGRMIAGAVQNGVLTDKDVSETIYSDSIVKRTFDKLKMAMDGKTQNLSKEEVSRLADSLQALYRRKHEEQLAREQQARMSFSGREKTLNINDIQYPSHTTTLREKRNKLISDYNMQNIDPREREQMLDAMIGDPRKGVAPRDPDAVMQIYLDKQRKRGQ